LIHVEIEHADSVTALRPRMFDYYAQLRRRHALPVLPVALYLRVGMEGVGWDVYEENFWDRRVLHFGYAYVGLPALDGEHYLAGENVLGLALSVLMRLPAERCGASARRATISIGGSCWRRRCGPICRWTRNRGAALMSCCGPKSTRKCDQ
jgi:hypothetical protein